MNAQKFLVFSAPSGSGKTTLTNHLLTQNLPLAFSISATTRAPRGKEQNGKHYYFLSPKTFDEKIEKGDFMEWEEVYGGHKYGTLKSEVQRIWDEGKHVIFDIDVVGGLNIKKQFPEQTLVVFVKAPSLEAIKERLCKRNTNEKNIEERITKVSEEMAFAPKFDHILINDDLDTAKKEALTLVQNFIKQ